jgi:hypothetical protein
VCVVTIAYERQGMALKAFVVIDGVRYYAGFWWSFLDFVDDAP